MLGLYELCELCELLVCGNIPKVTQTSRGGKRAVACQPDLSTFQSLDMFTSKRVRVISDQCRIMAVLEVPKLMCICFAEIESEVNLCYGTVCVHNCGSNVAYCVLQLVVNLSTATH